MDINDNLIVNFKDPSTNAVVFRMEPESFSFTSSMMGEGSFNLGGQASLGIFANLEGAPLNVSAVIFKGQSNANTIFSGVCLDYSIGPDGKLSASGVGLEYYLKKRLVLDNYIYQNTSSPEKLLELAWIDFRQESGLPSILVAAPTQTYNNEGARTPLFLQEERISWYEAITKSLISFRNPAIRWVYSDLSAAYLEVIPAVLNSKVLFSSGPKGNLLNFGFSSSKGGYANGVYGAKETGGESVFYYSTSGETPKIEEWASLSNEHEEGTFEDAVDQHRLQAAAIERRLNVSFDPSFPSAQYGKHFRVGDIIHTKIFDPSDDEQDGSSAKILSQPMRITSLSINYSSRKWDGSCELMDPKIWGYT